MDMQRLTVFLLPLCFERFAVLAVTLKCFWISLLLLRLSSPVAWM